jgi:hypothetical protein
MSNLKKALEIILESDQNKKFELNTDGDIINLDIDLAKKLNLIEIEFVKKKFASVNNISKIDGKSYIICFAGRFIVLKKIETINMIFYLSSGKAGKKSPAGKWYPIFGISGGWLNKTKDTMISKYYGSKILEQNCKELDDKIGDIRDLKNIDPINISLNDGEKQTELLNKGKSPSHENDLIGTFKNIYTIINKIDSSNTFKDFFSLNDKEGFTTDLYNKISGSEKNTPSNLQKFEKDLSSVKGENQNIEVIVNAIQYVQNNNVTDFEVSFKKESKKVILKVKNGKYTIDNNNLSINFNFNLHTLRNIATLIISQF